MRVNPRCCSEISNNASPIGVVIAVYKPNRKLSKRVKIRVARMIGLLKIRVKGRASPEKKTLMFFEELGSLICAFCVNLLLFGCAMMNANEAKKNTPAPKKNDGVPM